MLTLEEWRHWLEGVNQPFIIWTDHKSLAYIQTAKRLNSCQSCWILLFGRFKLSLTYRSGARNLKPDALSRQFPQGPSSTCPDTVLPSSCIVAGVTWEIESHVKEAQQNHPDRGNSPNHCLSLRQSGPRCSSGLTTPSLPATLVSTRPCSW